MVVLCTMMSTRRTLCLIVYHKLIISCFSPTNFITLYIQGCCEGPAIRDAQLSAVPETLLRRYLVELLGAAGQTSQLRAGQTSANVPCLDSTTHFSSPFCIVKDPDCNGRSCLGASCPQNFFTIPVLSGQLCRDNVFRSHSYSTCQTNPSEVGL